MHYFGSGSKYIDQRLDWHRKLKKVAVNYHGKDIFINKVKQTLILRWLTNISIFRIYREKLFGDHR